MITAGQLAAAIGCPFRRAERWAGVLNAAMDRFDITTPARQAAFLAQVGHESGRLVYAREIWNPEQCPWQARYEGRADLGNTEPGDGARFRGRGLIQITGRSNYRDCSIALFGYADRLLSSPELLEQPEAAALSAGWFWHAHGLNKWADAGDFDGVCDVINRGRKTEREGDANGFADRLALWNSSKEAIA